MHLCPQMSICCGHTDFLLIREPSILPLRSQNASVFAPHRKKIVPATSQEVTISAVRHRIRSVETALLDTRKPPVNARGRREESQIRASGWRVVTRSLLHPSIPKIQKFLCLPVYNSSSVPLRFCGKLGKLPLTSIPERVYYRRAGHPRILTPHMLR
jgi:hypothetical protein